jgi:hypothetical protein
MKKMQFLFFYEKYAWKIFMIWPYAIKKFFLFENVLKFFFFGPDRTRPFGLGQNWSGPRSTGIVDVNYNSRPLFTYEQWNFHGEDEEPGEG